MNSKAGQLTSPIQLFMTIDSHTIIAKQKCDVQIWMTGREIFARDNCSTVDLNLMWNQSNCLIASIALSGLPFLIQTQIWATNTRWGGTTLKGLQPCLMSMSNTTICRNWLSHYNWQTKMWWPIWMTGRKIFARDDHPTIDLN